MKLILMEPGRALLISALKNEIPRPKITGFSTGKAANFMGNFLENQPRPNVEYNGPIGELRKTIVSDNELIVSAMIPNDHLESPTIGNLMLKLNDVPFLWFILKFPVKKQPIDGAKHFAGNLPTQSMIVRIPRISLLLDLSNIQDFYAAPKYYDHLDSLPRPVLSGASEVVIQDSSFIYNKGKPIYAVRADNEWWGVPGMKSLEDTTMGVIGGGEVGDGYEYNL